jgi:integrase
VSFENDTITIKHTVVQLDNALQKRDVTKNESSYATLPLPKMIKARLKKWKLTQAQNHWLQPNDYIDEGYICTQVDGNLIKPNYVSQHFKLLLRNNGMPHIRFHDLRHSSASYLLSLGFNLKEIQTWLRHGDIQTTMNTYTHIDMAAKKNIADNLDERFTKFGI